MSEQEHEHDEHDHDEHDHDGHTHDWQTVLLAARDAEAHYYQHQFDWRGHGPPEDFDGPRFFPPAIEWRLVARLDATVPGAGEHVEVTTSTGMLRHMQVVGDVIFEKDGAEHRLTGYVSERDGNPVLFLPFRDVTSGVESYGAARYLEAPLDEERPDAPIDLDFNFAYNPSCAFSPAYDCPYPPPQNRLSIAVRAGEMIPTGTHGD